MKNRFGLSFWVLVFAVVMVVIVSIVAGCDQDVFGLYDYSGYYSDVVYYDDYYYDDYYYCDPYYDPYCY